MKHVLPLALLAAANPVAPAFLRGEAANDSRSNTGRRALVGYMTCTEMWPDVEDLVEELCPDLPDTDSADNPTTTAVSECSVYLDGQNQRTFYECDYSNNTDPIVYEDPAFFAGGDPCQLSVGILPDTECADNGNQDDLDLWVPYQQHRADRYRCEKTTMEGGCPTSTSSTSSPEQGGGV
ncbi:hypothetical protein ACHAXT_000092 [Thalassiosira profunda]